VRRLLFVCSLVASFAAPALGQGGGGGAYTDVSSAAVYDENHGGWLCKSDNSRPAQRRGAGDTKSETKLPQTNTHP